MRLNNDVLEAQILEAATDRGQLLEGHVGRQQLLSLGVEARQVDIAAYFYEYVVLVLDQVIVIAELA